MQKSRQNAGVKFKFSKKATKIDKIFTVDLTLCSKCQIDGEDFVAILEKTNFMKIRKPFMKKFKTQCASFFAGHENRWPIVINFAILQS